MLDYSIVVPVYNEEESIVVLHKELLNVLQILEPRTFEILYVDDCSSDGTPKILDDFREQQPQEIVVLHLLERSGQTQAMQRGFDEAHGKIVITLDADLQNDPNDIPKLISKLEQGYDVVCGWRKARQDKLLKALLSKSGNILQRLFTGLTVHDVSCTLRAYKKECLDGLVLDREGYHRFIPLILSLRGYRAGEVISHHRKRQFGSSKYSHKRIVRVIVDFFRIIYKERGRKGRS